MEEIRRKMEENEILANSLKEQAIEIFNTKAKEKESKKSKNIEEKQNRDEEELGLNEDEDRNISNSEKEREHKHKKEKKHVKKNFLIFESSKKFSIFYFL